MCVCLNYIFLSYNCDLKKLKCCIRQCVPTETRCGFCFQTPEFALYCDVGKIRKADFRTQREVSANF